MMPYISLLLQRRELGHLLWPFGTSGEHFGEQVGQAKALPKSGSFPRERATSASLGLSWKK